jgi:glutathione synthase/RimK-type ligase-like ATP-grasp enzyme
MNLLITNTQEDQAYLILRSLKDSVDRIVITVSGDSVFQRMSGMSAWSRHVSKRYRVPDCTADWKTGTIQPENTPNEEEYIQRIEEICVLESINVIFPSYDAEVYVFAKNKSRLAARGITAVVAEFDCIARILDKSLTLKAAEKVGFPIPRTRTPGTLAELNQAEQELAPPWLLKPRCNAHGANITLATTSDELKEEFIRLDTIQERPLLQEFVAAETKRNFYVLVARDSSVLSIFSPLVHRTRQLGLRTPCASVESTHQIPFQEEIQSLLRELGVWGGLTVQTIVDKKDGQPKLMEINPRFGHNLWFRTELGINEPLMFLRMALGQDPGPVPTTEDGVLLLDPLWDSLHLLGQILDQSTGWLREKLTGQSAAKGALEKEAIGPLLKNLGSDYFSRRRRITAPLNRGYLSDPLPPLVRIVRVFTEAIQRRAA